MKRAIQRKRSAILVLVALLSMKSAAEESSASETEAESSANKEMQVARAVPNTSLKTVALLKSHYPPADIQTLSTSFGEFTALWRPDESGDAYGAVLLIPADGQTANWPNTIDVLRNELPQNGWGTLSMDIQFSNAITRHGEQSTEKENQLRIQSAVNFLNDKGQYNIVLAAYGNSTIRALNYVASAPTKPSMGGPDTPQLDTPVRSIVLINPTSATPTQITNTLDEFPYKEIPLLDVILGKNYNDKIAADRRKSKANALRFERYIQLNIMEPSTTVFGKENRLSRRIRGFLNNNAKGIEIERR